MLKNTIPFKEYFHILIRKVKKPHMKKKKKKRSRLNQQKRRTFYVFQANGDKRKKHARSISYSRLHFVTEPTPNCNLRLLAEHPSKNKLRNLSGP